MAYGYADAVSSAMPGVRVAPPKLKSSGAVSKAVKRLSVKISRVTDYDNGKYRSGPQFNAVSTMYTEDTPMSQIIEEIWNITDNAYTKHREYRVDLKDITLLWTTSRTTVTSDWLQGTLSDLWRKVQANPLCVSPADAKRGVLDLHVVVDYDPAHLEEDSYVSKAEKQYITARKGKRANSVVAADLRLQSTTNSAVKKPRIPAAGKNAYTTALSRSEGSVHVVKKATYVSDEKNNLMWVEEDESFSVTIEKKSFASGKMKKAYKMLISGTSHAAKSFYDIGSDDGAPVSKEENLVYLKEELRRQIMARQCLERFRATAQKHICNVKVMESFILTVIEGSLKGQAWLVDPLLSDDPTASRKFSGTEKAGENEDLAGKTCDAFAHFSLFDSEGSVIFVDIQGINTAALPLMSRKAETVAHSLILFDLMAHSSSQDYGHGDQGWDGIGDFVDQHRCNSICNAIGLPTAEDIWLKNGPDAAKESDESQYDDDDDDNSPTLNGLRSIHKGPRPAQDNDTSE